MNSVWVLTISEDDDGPLCDVRVYDTYEAAYAARVFYVMDKFADELNRNGVPEKPDDDDDKPPFPKHAMVFFNQNNEGDWEWNEKVPTENVLDQIALYASYHEGKYLFNDQIREREILRDTKKLKLSIE